MRSPLTSLRRGLPGTTTCLLVACFSQAALAQLTFVPDVDLRAAINAEVPGAVDANGYIDGTNPSVLNTYNLNLNITWDPVDLTGIEAFTGAQVVGLSSTDYLSSLSIPAWPPNATNISMYMSVMSISLPANWPAGLAELAISGVYDGLISLPTFPPSLALMNLNGLGNLTSVPQLPNSLTALSLQGLQDLAVLPAFPASITYLDLRQLPNITTLPALPPALDELFVIELYNLTALPPLPQSSYSFVSFEVLPQLTLLPDLPDSCRILWLNDLPLITSVGPWPVDLVELGTDQLALVQELPVLPDSLERLYIFNMAALACLPALPSPLVHFELDASPLITCFPNLPSLLTFFTIDGVPTPLTNDLLCTLLNSTCPLVNPAISGMVFVDDNANGQFDPGEMPYASAHVDVGASNVLTGVAFDGTYSVGLAIGSHSFNCVPHSLYVDSITPASHSAVFTAIAQVDSLNDFAVHLQPNVQDLVVDLTSLSVARPGFTSEYLISYHNAGTQLQDGSITFVHDPAMGFVSSVPMPDAITGNTLTWDFTQLQLTEMRSVAVTLSTPVGTLGVPLLHTAVAGPITTDEAPADNTSSWFGTVVGSFDPNDKQVSPEELLPAEVVAGDRVVYTVRFQNTGTYQADRVLITDTLSGDLQWNTMQVVSASHDHIWYIADGVLHVVFDNINLPDSTTDEAGSHGFVKFSIQPVSTLLLGDDVQNIANIYFDFNEPIITNAAVFTINDNTAIAPSADHQLLLSPNPTNERLTVRWNSAVPATPWTIVDLLGHVVLSGTMTGTSVEVDVQNLAAGTYHLKVQGLAAGMFVKR